MPSSSCDPPLRVPRPIVDPELVAGALAAQELLGQRRALVGQVLLGAEQQDIGEPAVLAVGGDRRRCRGAGAHDHQPFPLPHARAVHRSIT